jgi:hypothetical protein
MTPAEILAAVLVASMTRTIHSGSPFAFNSRLMARTWWGSYDSLLTYLQDS